MKNKEAREELERLYGKKCFIEKLHLRKDDKPRVYKSKGQMKKMKQLTFHHIREKSKGGDTSVENGALLSNENHAWFHQQPPSIQSQMNEIFQKYKAYANECQVEYVDELDLPFKINCIDFTLNEREKYNRARKKEEDRHIINNWEEER